MCLKFFRFEAGRAYELCAYIKKTCNIKFLKRRFTRTVDKYGSEFQKWSLPLDLNSWFFDIINN